MRSNMPRWWGYAKMAIRDYPKLHAKLEDMRSTSMTASYTGMPHGSGVGDPVYQACSRTLPLDDQRAHDAVEQAIIWVDSLNDHEIRLKLINLVFWEQSRTLEEAAYDVGYSYWWARKLNAEFIYHVAFFAGFTDKPERNDNSH